MAHSQQTVLKIAILGCGLMGTALLQGWLRHAEPRHTFSAYVRTEASLKRLRRDIDSLDPEGRVSYWVGDDLVKAATEADVVILSFLPKDLREVIALPGLCDKLHRASIVSVLAGVSLQDLEKGIAPYRTGEGHCTISRVIPTLAAKIGESVTLMAEDATSKDVFKSTATVRDLMSMVGSFITVPEALMNEATAIGATVNALAIVALDSITDASVAEGVPRTTAFALATQSLRSICGLMLQENMTPETVKQSMSTPGGITLNAVVNLDANSRAGIAAATRGAIHYTKRMND